MAESGISLGNTAVSADTSQQRADLSVKPPNASHGEGAAESNDGFERPKPPISAWSRIQGGGSRLVDTFA